MRTRLAVAIILGLALAESWYFIRPVAYVSGVVEKQIHGFGSQLIPALASNCSFTRISNGYQPKPEPPQAPAGLRPQELQAWTAFAQLHPAAADLVPTFPGHYSEGIKVRSQGMAVSLRPLGSSSASAQIENGKLVYHNVYTSTDSLNVVSAGRSEEFLLLHDASAPQKFEYDLSGVTGVKNIRLSDNSVHFTNAQGQQLRIEAPWLMESGGQKVANAVQWQISYPNGPSQPRLALVVNNAGKLHYPVVIDPTWVTPNGSLNTARYNHTATLLNNGQVLVAGGYNGTDALTSAELYNPATGTWIATGSLNTARDSHSSTLLTNGQVLVAGGNGNSGSYLTSAELYNPANGTWTATGSMNAARYIPTATLLPNGQVLVEGGAGSSSILTSAELYNPANGTWTATGSLNTARFEHTATLLPNGQVLAAGGYNGSYLTSAELYNPTNGTWTATGSLNTARQSHTATLLPNGQVLVVGGVSLSGTPSGVEASAELYSPTTGTWTYTGSLNAGRYVHTASLLPNGQVLVAGGANYYGLLSSAEAYNPANGTWTTTGNLNAARSNHTATLLSNGQVLVAGGSGNSGILTSAELYDLSQGQGAFSTTSSLNTGRAYQTATLLPNGEVLVAGGNKGVMTFALASLFNPASGSWTATGNLNIARSHHTATLLPNGQVLVAGGMPVAIC